MFGPQNLCQLQIRGRTIQAVHLYNDEPLVPKAVKDCADDEVVVVSNPVVDYFLLLRQLHRLFLLLVVQIADAFLCEIFGQASDIFIWVGAILRDVEWEVSPARSSQIQRLEGRYP